MSLLIHPRAVDLAKRVDMEDLLRPQASVDATVGAVTPSRQCRINTDRLWAEIMATSTFGGSENSTAMNRLALTDSDKDVRDWFRKQALAIGCEVRVDQMGNIFAIMGGEAPSVHPIGMGSHLDTQPSGGRFDGILGVIGALEILRTVRAAGLKTYAPLAAICWTNEEGARFESGCTGSAVWASHLSLNEGLSLPSRCGSTNVGHELRKIGYRGPVPASHALNPLSAHLELHIEQASRLEKAKQRVGVVKGVQGNIWYRVRVQGERAHAGSTPMSDRADAVVATAHMVTWIEGLARQTGGFATVGMVSTEGGSSNCVPGQACFTIDMRHSSAEVLGLMERSVLAEMHRLERNNTSLRFTPERVFASPAVSFDSVLAEHARAASEAVAGREAVGEMISFAGHDSAMTALCVPTVMLFVPSRGGISHAPEEFTSKNQCGDGVQALLELALSYDGFLRERASRRDSSQNC